MAAPMVLVQKALSALVGDPDAACSGNSTLASLFHTAQSNSVSLPALVLSMLTGPALQDWFKLIVIGGLFELCRRAGLQAYNVLYERLFITAVLMEDDVTYSWVTVWLSKHPSWTNARDVQISSRSFGLGGDAVLVPGEEGDDPNAIARGDRRLSRILSRSSSHAFWYKHRWCRVSRRSIEDGNPYRSKADYLELCILSWDHRILDELLLEAKKLYKASQKSDISIHISDSDLYWRQVATRPKRPLSSIVLDPGIKDLLIEDAREFLSSRNWYAARGIPFRRGYLLYGAPGSGKTSIIHSLAGELELDIYIVSLSRAGLDDNGLSELISELPEKCIALMEDIDVAFTSTLSRDSSNTAQGDSQPPQTRQTQESSESKITLSGLLNALDGVAAQEGRLLFATTNKYSSLDPALTRPGRMDLHIEFKLASRYQAKELYRCFYLPDSELETEGKNLASKDKDWERKELTEKDSLLLNPETASDTSEGTTVIPSSPSSPKPALPLINTDDVDSKHSPTSTTLPSEAPSPSQMEISPVSLLHSRTERNGSPKLSRLEVDRLAIMFSELLPEEELSMASLQGYLMMYKTRPVAAVKEFAVWIEKQRKDKKERKEAMLEAKEKKTKQEETAASVAAATPADTVTAAT